MYVMCSNPTEACYIQDCNNCLGFKEVSGKIEEAFELNCIENIPYKQWTQVEKRTSLQTFVKLLLKNYLVYFLKNFNTFLASHIIISRLNKVEENPSLP